MTVFEIEFLLWYYSRTNDFNNLDSPNGKAAVNKFLKLELIKPCVSGNKYKGNQVALEIYINKLINVPLPKQVKVWQ